MIYVTFRDNYLMSRCGSDGAYSQTRQICRFPAQFCFVPFFFAYSGIDTGRRDRLQLIIPLSEQLLPKIPLKDRNTGPLLMNRWFYCDDNRKLWKEKVRPEWTSDGHSLWPCEDHLISNDNGYCIDVWAGRLIDEAVMRTLCNKAYDNGWLSFAGTAKHGFLNRHLAN